MKKELQKQLFDRYPKIFRQKDLSMKETAMCWGIDTFDGWYWLIDQLCDSIQSYTDRNRKPQVEATQVKEKFGTLCFYTNGSDDYIEGMIRLAESMSGHICENCGSREGASNEETNHWWRTRCLKCKDIR